MISLTINNAVAEVVLDAPHKLNSLDEQALRDLSKAYDDAAAAASRGQVRALLLRAERLDVVATADRPEPFLAAVDEYRPDVAIVDVRMPPTNTDEGIVAAVEATTGITPISIGKPAPRLLEIAAHAVGRDPREAIMVGDGILTDLAAANALGARCVFMLTGVSTREQLRGLAPGDRPVAVAEDAAQLAAALESLAAEQATAAAPA